MVETVENRLVEVPENPIPAGARVKMIGAVGGVRLRVACWSPVSSTRDAVVVIMQGRSEFIEKYAETIGDLLMRGFHVVAFDWRGQGGSDRILPDRAKGHVKRFDDYLEDVDAVMKKIVAPLGVSRKIALAHSMGGAVALRMALRDDEMFERFILSAPMIGLSLTENTKRARFTISLLAAMGFASRYVPGGNGNAYSPFDENFLTGERRRFERVASVLNAAPHLGVGSPTLGWAATSIAAMAELQDEATPRAISNPVLIVAGPEDHITSMPIAERFARGLKAGRFVPIEGARHEILQENDTIRARFWQEFDRFLAE